MSLIKKILRKKIIFKRIKSVDVVVLDDGFSNIKFNNLKSHHYNQNNYFFSVLILSLFYYCFNFYKNSFGKVYFKTFLTRLDPTIGIGHEMNDKIFYFKKIFPNKISICYQYGFIFDEDETYYREKFLNKEVDYYFVYDNRSKKKMRKFVKSNYIINGSTKINENNDKKKYKQNYDIMFVSRYRSEKNKLRNNYDKFLLKILREFCKKNNLKLVIALVSKRKDKQIDEKFHQDENNFYNLLNTNGQFISENSFLLAKKSKLVVCSNSNLGYELLFAKKKVVFFNSKKDKHNFFKKNNGPFWYYGTDEKKIKNILKKYLNKNNKLWFKKVLQTDEFSNFFKNYQLYFKNNMIKKTINKLLYERI